VPPELVPIEDLNPDEPFGPITNGSCPQYNGKDQLVAQNLFGTPGGFCSPECSGIAETCPDHTQTVAKGTCFFNANNKKHCVAWCYVDSAQLFPSGTQCQCGATCQPYGPTDGEGNARGLCTFE